MWRWSSTKCSAWFKLWVFSTYVEVIPCIVFLKPVNCRILHVCGGDPTCPKDRGNFFEYSPRMWRWSLQMLIEEKEKSVFSTYVEVIPLFDVAQKYKIGILHVCGGDPVQMRSLQLHFVYSPRMWRWSWQAPTIHFSWCCILHVCGGDPTSLQVIHGDHLVFSTYVEVILRLLWPYWFGVGILHVCGGDPIDTFFGSWLQVYSPRMWRWSHAYDQMAADQAVFSTYVEVIPIIIFCTSNVWCILHVCGGDPHTRLSMSSVCQYSPRMWRWSRPCRILHQL